MTVSLAEFSFKLRKNLPPMLPRRPNHAVLRDCPSRTSFALALGLVFPAMALAQTPPARPDAGTSLESVRPQATPARPAPATEVQQEVRPVLRGESGFRTRVSTIRITGASVFAQSTLLPLVQSLQGKEAGIAELDAAAGAITRFYRDNGYFVARAYLPQQEIKDGAVEIAVLEGRYEQITVTGPGNRLAKSAAEGYLAANLKAGDVVRESNLERALLLMNDFPSVDVKSTLRPGAAVGTADLGVTATEGNLVSGGVDADNFGNKYTGRYRLGGSLQLNSPTGYSDSLSLRVSTARGLDYVRAGYQIPVFYSGLKAGVSASGLRYKLGDIFAAGNFSGESRTVGAFVTYPFVRSRALSLWGTLAADRKHLENRGGGATISDKTVNAWSLSLAGDGADSFGGQNEGSVTLSTGRLNLDGFAPDRVADAATAQAHGRYTKLAYHLQRVQSYQGSRFSWLVRLDGQWASKNLDSSEKMALGGYAGLRGYAQGEATGDSAAILTGEARFLAIAPGVGPLGGGVQLAGFVDQGWVRLHENTWAGWQGGNARLANNYRLASAGLGVAWAKSQAFSVRANVSRTLGSNRGLDITGRDSENGSSKTRAWVQGVVWF